jgi:hypothetical protein
VDQPPRAAIVSPVEIGAAISGVLKGTGLVLSVEGASTKGTTALWTELRVAARALGPSGALATELEAGRSDVAGLLIAQFPSLPRRARRSVGEMEESAATFAELGLRPCCSRARPTCSALSARRVLRARQSGSPNTRLDSLLAELTGHLTVSGEPWTPRCAETGALAGADPEWKGVSARC